ncbi:MAG: G8 domain-containing protein [Trueperaceae bacterium]
MAFRSVWFRLTWNFVLILFTLAFLLVACQTTTPKVKTVEDKPTSPGTEQPISEVPNPVEVTPDPEIPPTITSLKWSDPASWPSGQVPTEGQQVEIPAGKAISLDVSPPALGGLFISGTLVFANQDIDLSTDWIMIHGEGKLEIGVPSQPYTKQATITLTGPDEDVMSMNMGGRVLGVMEGGTLSMIGQARTSWTKLATTAQQGDTTLTLQDAVNWQVGDQIVIASTDFDYAQAESFTVRRVADKTITLDKPLAYMHYGELQTYNGQSVDQRAEVGLLSRNITIRGPSAEDTFGGHVMVMSGAKAVIDSVEFVHMGQENRLGRYPIHWHQMGDTSRGQYIRNSSIHESFNRCVTVHASNGIKVQKNITYDIPGHCFFLEDGAEVDNIIEDNLGIAVQEPKSGKALLVTDREFPGPAVYWITHPKNIVRNNVAAGSDGTGFWYAFPKHPTGPSATTEINNRHVPLAESKNNVAHSNNVDGFHIDSSPTSDLSGIEISSYEPHQDPNSFKTEYGNTYNNSQPVTAVFEGIIAYKNRRNGVWLRGKHHVVKNPILADNAIGATLASDESVLQGGLMVGETANVGTAYSWEASGEGGRSLPKPWKDCEDTLECYAFPIRGFEFYDGKVGVEDTHFAGYKEKTVEGVTRKASALSYLNFTNFSTSPYNYAKSLTFADDGTKRVNLFTRTTPANPNEDTEDGYRSAIFIDQDGSVTGDAPGRAVVADNPFLLAGLERCYKSEEWNAWICNEKYVKFRAETSSQTDITLSLYDSNHTLYGDGNTFNTTHYATVREKQSYGLSFKDNVPPSWFRLVLEDATSTDEWLRFDIPLAQAPKRVYDGANYLAQESGPATSLAELNTSTISNYFYDANAKMLHIKIVAVDPWKLKYDNLEELLDYAFIDIEP